MSGRNEGGLPVPNTAGAGGPGSMQQQQQRSGSQGGHHHSKSHSGLNSYASAATTPNMMDRASSSTGLSPSSGSNALSPSGGNNSTASNNVAKFRASIDAARSLYANTGNMTPGFTPGASSPSLGPPRTAGGSKRPSSDMLAGSALAGLAGVGLNAENDAIDKWFEDLHHYEATLEEMAAASLDQSFKEELGAIEQWFKVLSEAERTAALYSLLQNSTQVQIRFFITVLQQMARTDPMNALLSPANPQQASMEAQMEAKLASLGLKSPAAASPAVRQFARQSLGAMPGMDLSGFLSPNSAMHQQGNSSPSARHTSLDDALNSSTANNDAANLLAQQRARLQANAANRISAPGSLLSAHDHAPLRSPLWSQANNEQVAERSGRSPSPDGRSSNAGRSRPASMISEHSGALSSNNNNTASNGVANNASSRPDINASFANIPEAQLSPLLTSTNWANMMQTPLMTSFNGAGEPNSANPDFGNSTQARANWATQSINNSTNSNPNFALDDAKKFRRQARASDAGMEGANGNNNQQNGVQGILSGMYEQNKRNQQQQQGQSQGLNNANQAAAISAQQNWRNVNGLFNGGSPNPGQGMPGSPDLNNLASLQAAMASPQIAMANLLAAQQQIQQQMQLQQNLNMLNSMGMSPMGMMNMPNQLQNQQMLSPALGGLGMGMFQQPPHSSASSNSRDRRSPRPDRSVNGDKSKSSAPIIPGTGTNPDEPLDMKLLSDVPAWLRSLRLHKYTPNFEHSNWKEMVGMNDAALDAKGVNALGARRKLLKVFENVRNQQGIPHPPGSEIPDSHTPDPTANDA